MTLPKKRFIPLALMLALVVMVLSIALPISFNGPPTAEEVASLLDRDGYFTNPNAVYWEAYNRNKPIPFDSPVWWKTDASYDAEAYVEMSLIEVIRGEAANTIAEKMDPSNTDKLTDGTEYMYMRFFIKIQSSDFSRRYSICSYDFDFVRQNGSAYGNHFAAGFEDDLEMFSGDEGCIEICHVVDVGDKPLAVCNDDIWFSAWY